ncbi:MAG: atpB [Gemmatimonadetes bacterium]|nr:atpB [Gemmatimonadota bacterium]
MTNLRTTSRLLALTAMLLALPAASRAQEPAPQPVHSAETTATRVAGQEQALGTAEAEPAEACAKHDPADIITPHITDSHCMEIPWLTWPTMSHEIELPRWKPIGHFRGQPIDISPTKHVVMMLFAGFLACLVLISAARSSRRTHATVGRSTGFATGIESMVLFIRNEVAVKNLGHHGEGYAPFILTLFFFILFANLLGLIPYGSTATGNIAVTGTLAIATMIVIEVAGMRANGVGYLSTIFYWNKDLGIVMRVVMFLVMSPVELAGKLSKPFALAIRLFANMTAGHIVVLAFIGLIFTFKSYAIGIAPMGMAVAIMMLEIFVAFLQAYIFALLAAVFIGQIRESHH